MRWRHQLPVQPGDRLTRTEVVADLSAGVAKTVLVSAVGVCDHMLNLTGHYRSFTDQPLQPPLAP